MKITCIVGARPNFMKVAPILAALSRLRAQGGTAIDASLVHTGQHYDARMSDAFFRDLGLPAPDANLEVGSGSHAQQTARVMLALEPVLEAGRPDVLLVVGDVNSTLAATLVARKMDIAVAHVEAGLRSFDRTMPEEINRICVDAISDILFTTDRFATANLRNEGVDADRIHFVGNVMIDSVLAHLGEARSRRIPAGLGLEPRHYAVMTLHRPSNVDHPDRLSAILDAVIEGTGDMRLIFPVHPRTRARIEAFGLMDRLTRDGDKVRLVEPLGYLDFLGLNADARILLTDSGGVQEEAVALAVPCVTIRDTTERPVTTLNEGNIVSGTGSEEIRRAIGRALTATSRDTQLPELWDGAAAERIVEVLARRYA